MKHGVEQCHNNTWRYCGGNSWILQIGFTWFICFTSHTRSRYIICSATQNWYQPRVSCWLQATELRGAFLFWNFTTTQPTFLFNSRQGQYLVVKHFDNALNIQNPPLLYQFFYSLLSVASVYCLKGVEFAGFPFSPAIVSRILLASIFCYQQKKNQSPCTLLWKAVLICLVFSFCFDFRGLRRRFLHLRCLVSKTDSSAFVFFICQSRHWWFICCLDICLHGVFCDVAAHWNLFMRMMWLDGTVWNDLMLVG